MPVHAASKDGRPGYQWGSSTIYTYAPGDETGRKRAKQRAFLQGYAATGPHKADISIAFPQEGDVAKDLSSKSWKRPTLADFTDKAWDSLSAAEKRRIGTHFAWAPADAATFGDFKLPIKGPDGKLNHNAIANAESRLDATQGIPAAAKAKIRANLQRLLGTEDTQKDLTGDVHIPTAMGTSLAQYRRRRRGVTKGALESFPAEVVIAPGFVVAQAEALVKDAALPVAFADPAGADYVALRRALRSGLTVPVLAALAKAMPGAVRLLPAGAGPDPVALYDLVLKRSLPEDAGDEDDEDLEDEDPDGVPLLDEDEEDEGLEVRVAKADATQQKLWLVVLEPDAVDTQDDFTAREEIEKTAHQFMQDYRAGRAHLGYKHQRPLTDAQAVLCEHYVLPEQAKVGTETLPRGTWVQAWKIHDPKVWGEVQRGELAGGSFGGTGLRIKAPHPMPSPANG